jgi:hypothetical protein
MSDAGHIDEDLTPAERRLWEHLELLRANPPVTAPDLISRILGRARWQIAIRDPLIFAGALSGALAEGLSLLIAPPVSER